MKGKVNFAVCGIALVALGWFGRQLVPTRMTTQTMQVEAERRGSELNDSRRWRLRLPSGEEYNECGKIEFGDNEMSRETGTLVLFVSFANPTERLVPNEFVRVISAVAIPLVFASGAGSVGSHSLGITLFGGFAFFTFAQTLAFPLIHPSLIILGIHRIFLVGKSERRRR